MIDGGLNSYEGESTPIFVSSIESKSSVEKTKFIRVKFKFKKNLFSAKKIINFRKLI